MSTYAYDPLLRLTSLAQDVAGTAQDVTSTFSYNPASQIAARSRSNDAYAWGGAVALTRVYSTNGLNQYTQSGPVALSYDGRGNLTGSGTQSYTYTAENRMKSASGATGGATLYYDALGRLIEYDTSVSTRFAFDGDELASEVANPSGAILRRYVYGPGDDEPLVWYEGAGASDKRWLHSDERGSVVAITNASGAVSAINSYDDHGNPGTSNMGRFGYTGQAWLAETGLWYYKNRMYSATLGRFMQTDPTGYDDGPNLYAYVGGDPINASDPSGLICLPNGTNLGGSNGGEAQGQSCLPGSVGPDIIVTAQFGGGSSSVATGQFIPNINFNLGEIIVTARSFLDAYRNAICGDIKRQQKNGTGTVQLGAAVTGDLGPVGATAGAGFAADAKGNIGLYGFAGPGLGVGLSGTAGLSLQVSNAQNIGGLRGLFLNSSASLGVGFAGTVDVFADPVGQRVAGGGVTLGGGLGASIFGGATETGIIPLGNPLNSATNILRCGR